MEKIIFNGTDRGQWINLVCEEQNRQNNNNNSEIIIYINGIESIDELEPMHIVLLAGLRQNLKDKGYQKCFLSTDNNKIKDFLFEDVNLGKYWRGETPVNHIQSKTVTKFNLWHVTEEKLEFYSRDVLNYLSNKFFVEKDLSSLQESLIEAFRNIFDHADANGNSFSYISYNLETTKLQVAICDFGKGIAKSIRDYFKEIDNDKDALLKAIECSVTTRSQKHNRGFGLDTIICQLSDSDTMRIVSNQALLFINSSDKKCYLSKKNFKGTLIYYEVSLNKFEDKEIIDTFTL